MHTTPSPYNHLAKAFRARAKETSRSPSPCTQGGSVPTPAGRKRHPPGRHLSKFREQLGEGSGEKSVAVGARRALVLVAGAHRGKG